MALNYGLGQNFSTVVPVINGTCILAPISKNLQREYPNPPGHGEMFDHISILDSGSFIHLLSHVFKNKLPTSDNTISYHLSLVNKTTNAISNKKLIDFTPAKPITHNKSYDYVIDRKIRVGDVCTQKEIDDSAYFYFSVKRESTSGGTIGGGANGGANKFSYIILSPFALIL